MRTLCFAGLPAVVSLLVIGAPLARSQQIPGPQVPYGWYPGATPNPAMPSPSYWTGGDAAPAPQKESCPSYLKTCQLMGGAYFKSGLGPNVPSVNYAPIDLRIGCSSLKPCLDGTCFRGFFEGILDLMGAPIFTGPGEVITGPSLLLRYNYVQPGHCFVPYIQGGAGFVYNDIYRDPNQTAVGDSVEFLLQGAIGGRYVVSRHWTLDAEFGYHHISNGGIRHRNTGLNDIGGSLGFTYYLPK